MHFSQNFLVETILPQIKAKACLMHFTSLFSSYLCLYPLYFKASLVAQMVKNLPAMWETWVRSLGWEKSLEKGMATHPSILAWRTSWTEEPGGLQSIGSHRSLFHLSSLVAFTQTWQQFSFFRKVPTCDLLACNALTWAPHISLLLSFWVMAQSHFLSEASFDPDH